MFLPKMVRNGQKRPQMGLARLKTDNFPDFWAIFALPEGIFPLDFPLGALLKPGELGSGDLCRFPNLRNLEKNGPLGAEIFIA